MLRSLATRIAMRATFVRIILYALLYAACLGTIAYLSYLITGGNGTFRVIELEPVWHPQEVYAHFSGMFESEQAYVKAILLVDVVNILAYTFMFSTLIAWLFKKSYAADSPRMLLCLVPFIMALLDIVENLLMYVLMNDGKMTTACILNMMIIAKLATGAVCGIIILAGGFSAIKKK